MPRHTLDDAISSLDELFCQLAELSELVEAQGLELTRIRSLLTSKDAANVMMLKHTERLIREKEEIERAYGRMMLKADAEKHRKATADQDDFQQDVERYFAELRKGP